MSALSPFKWNNGLLLTSIILNLRTTLLASRLDSSSTAFHSICVRDSRHPWFSCFWAADGASIPCTVASSTRSGRVFNSGSRALNILRNCTCGIFLSRLLLRTTKCPSKRGTFRYKKSVLKKAPSNVTRENGRQYFMTSKLWLGQSSSASLASLCKAQTVAITV